MNSDYFKICNIYYKLPAYLLMELEVVISDNKMNECYTNGKWNNVRLNVE